MKIGIIGLGDMGKLYARKFANSGLEVQAADLPEKTEALRRELGVAGVQVRQSGAEVARDCDLILYSVEARNIEKVVSSFGPFTKPGAIVGGQTAVKTVEVQAFEKFLPQGVNIVTCHSLHGPSVDTKGQKLVLVRHRADDQAYVRAKDAFAKLESQMIELSDYKTHDQMTADIQAVTHLCFESMGTAWKNSGIRPWSDAGYASLIDEVKILMALRIFSSKAHVYSELAILNPFARTQIEAYAASVSDLFRLMLRQDEKVLRARVELAAKIFRSKKQNELLLGERVIQELEKGRTITAAPNSHLSLLAMADAWRELGVDPYANLVCQTPPYRLRVGIAEYLFRNPELLEAAIQAALHDRESKVADLEFHRAVHDWALVIRKRDLAYYNELFDEAKAHLAEKLAYGKQRSDQLIASGASGS